MMLDIPLKNMEKVTDGAFVAASAAGIRTLAMTGVFMFLIRLIS